MNPIGGRGAGGTRDADVGADLGRGGGVLGVLVVAFEWPLLFGGLVPGGLDGPRQSLPQRVFLHEVLRSGEFPWWNPLDAMGVPWLAQLSPGLLHPLNWVAALVDPVRAFAWNHVGAVVLATSGAAMAAWARGLGPSGVIVAGAAFGVSGAVVSQANLHYLVAVATAPWVFAGAGKFLQNVTTRTLLATSGALVFVLFAGDVQGVVILGAWLLALAFASESPRRSSVRIVLAGVVTLGLGAVQLWPSIEAAVRSGRLGEAFVGRDLWSLSLPELWNVVFGLPGAFSMGSAVRASLGLPGMPWIDRPGLGPVFLALAVAGAVASKRARVEAAIGVALVWASFGPGSGMWDAFVAMPLFRSFQYPEKLLPFATLAFALAAADGASVLREDDRALAWFRRVAVTLGVIALVLALVTTVSPETLQVGWSAATSRTWWVVAMVTLVVVVVVPSRVPVAAMPIVLAAALVVPPLLTSAPLGELHDATADAARPWAADEILKRHDAPTPPRLVGLEDVGPGARVPPRDLLASGFPLQFGLESLETYAPFPAPGIAELCPWPDVRLEFCARVQGLEYLVRPIATELPAGFTSIARDESRGVEVLRFDSPLPRVRFARAVVTVPDFETAVARTLEVAAEGTVVVEGPGTDGPSGVGEAWITDFRANHVAVKAHAEDRGLLVLNDAWDPGWVARVDGVLANVRHVNGLARGVWLEEGTHEIVFAYEPASVRWGLVVSVLTLVAVLLAGRRRRAGSR